MKIAYTALALLLALGGGFATGWHAKGVSVTAAGAKQSKSETKAVVADVNKQATAQHRQAVAEQGKSQTLAHAQADIRIHADGVREDIDHAIFIPYALPAADVCPDVTASAEFVRLYDAAASGSTDTPAAAGTR